MDYSSRHKPISASPSSTCCGGSAPQLELRWKKKNKPGLARLQPPLKLFCWQRRQKEDSSQSFLFFLLARKPPDSLLHSGLGCTASKNSWILLAELRSKSRQDYSSSKKNKIKDGNIFSCLSGIQHFDVIFRIPTSDQHSYVSGTEVGQNLCRVVALLEYRMEISAATCHLHSSCTISFSGILSCSLNTLCFKQ